MMSFLWVQKILYGIISLIFIVGVIKFLTGHGHAIVVERATAVLMFTAMLVASLVWTFERKDTTRGLKDGSITPTKKNLLGICVIVMGLSGLLWWFTHPNAADRWVWLLGAVLFSGIGLVFILKKPKASK